MKKWLVVTVGVFFGACGTAGIRKGTVSVNASAYKRGESVRVAVTLKNGSVGTYLRIQRLVGGRWREVAVYNPKQECPQMLERPEGGYKFVTKRSAMCRLLQGTWVVFWQQMVRKQCTKPEPVPPGRYRICVAQFVKKCAAREGPYGFERPRGASFFICSKPFDVR